MSLSEWTSDFKRLVTRSGDGYVGVSNDAFDLPDQPGEILLDRLPDDFKVHAGVES